MHHSNLQTVSPTFRRNRITITAVLIVLLIPLALSYYSILRWYTTDVLFNDYGVFYLSSQFYAQSAKDPYTKIFAYIRKAPFAHSTTHSLHIGEQNESWKLMQLAANLNPPFFVAGNLLLATWNFPESFMLWSMLSIVSALCSIFLLVRFYAPPNQRLPWYLGTILAFFSYFPTFISLQDGQLGLILFCLLTLIFTAIKLKQDHTAGILLGLALAIKPLLGLFAVLFLLQGRWSLLIYCGLSYLICFIIGLAIFGYPTYLNYVHCLQHIGWFSYGYNASILGFLVRLFGLKEPNVPLIHYPTITIYLYYSFTAIIVGLWVYYNGKKVGHDQQNDWGFASTIVVTLLISPLGWLYYFPWLLISLYVCSDYLRRTQSSPWLLLCLVFAVGLSALPMPVAGMIQIKGMQLILLWYGAGFYALILLFACLIKLGSRNINATPIKNSIYKTSQLCMYSLCFGLAFIAPYATLITMGRVTHQSYQALPIKQISEFYFTE